MFTPLGLFEQNLVFVPPPNWGIDLARIQGWDTAQAQDIASNIVSSVYKKM